MGWLDKLSGALSEATFNLNNAGTLGSMAIPGQAQLELPAGRVRVTFEQGAGYSVGFDRESTPKAPQMPGMTVRPAGGGPPVEFRRFGGANVRSRDDRVRALIGSLVVPHAGVYVIDAPEPFDEPYMANFSHFERGPDPKLLFG